MRTSLRPRRDVRRLPWPRPPGLRARAVSPGTSRRTAWAPTNMPTTARTPRKSCCRPASPATTVLRDFGRRVILHQPLDYAKAVGTDFVKLFVFRRTTFPATSPSIGGSFSVTTRLSGRTRPRQPGRTAVANRASVEPLATFLRALPAQRRLRARNGSRHRVHRRAAGRGRRRAGPTLRAARRVLAPDPLRAGRAAGGGPVPLLLALPAPRAHLGATGRSAGAHRPHRSGDTNQSESQSGCGSAGRTLFAVRRQLTSGSSASRSTRCL